MVNKVFRIFLSTPPPLTMEVKPIIGGALSGALHYYFTGFLINRFSLGRTIFTLDGNLTYENARRAWGAAGAIAGYYINKPERYSYEKMR
jgi:hypothetical protein